MVEGAGPIFFFASCALLMDFVPDGPGTAFGATVWHEREVGELWDIRHCENTEFLVLIGGWWVVGWCVSGDSQVDVEMSVG
jgi:hypothetical protein